jgi:hypothetical protein
MVGFIPFGTIIYPTNGVGISNKKSYRKETPRAAEREAAQNRRTQSFPTEI